ncbi:hypothetical protein TNCV_3239041 [Trichonephila clavipes]|nr:hypothetical protein TNCV_3239041 [Trichonephila clavipes]
MAKSRSGRSKKRRFTGNRYTIRAAINENDETSVKLSNPALLRQILKNRQFGVFLRVVFRSCNPTTTRNAGARNSR